MSEEVPVLGDVMQFKNIHHSLQSIFSVLSKEEFTGLPEFKDLTVIFRDVKAHTQKRTPHNSTSRKPFIVVEGLDGSGKTTVTRIVAEKMRANCLSTPPNSLLHLRKKFDQFGPCKRRAFYALGNYAAALEVEDTCKRKPVVMDRFWHSTAAYGIAEELDRHNGLAALPPPGNALYNWPWDLIKPDCVFLLTVSEETRNKRLGHRDIAITEEEKKLTDNSSFRALLLEAYKRMDNPPLTMIDANQELEAVVNDIVKHLSDCSLLPVNEESS
ncbi:UMP-CMP kinase 2, mitochondrial isoform X2 [Anabrus simplex]